MKLFFLIAAAAGLAAAQPNVCSTTAAPVILRAEGLTERIGDILYTCTGAPGAQLTVNLSVQLNTGITNRLSSGNTVTGTVLTVNNGFGPQAVTMQPMLQSANNLIWNGVPLQYSAQGTLTIDIADVRANVTGLPVGGQVIAQLSMSSGSLLITQSSLVAGATELGLYVGYSSQLICAQNGSPLPGTPSSFANLIMDGTAFTSTRITEGFAGAFTPRSAAANLNADTGTRFIVRYSGFPQGARLFVPTVVAGSDAVQQTAGGDMGVPESGGAYAPSTSGSLLLALVAGADSTGAGGSLVFTPGAVGSGTVTFDSVTELQLSSGSTYAVYEVVDSNPFTLETAQFPTFLGLAPNTVSTAVQTFETVSFAPASGVTAASTTAPIPRFVASVPPNDCGIIGDCGATYFPQLTVNTPSLQYTLSAGALNQTQYVPVNNSGGGVLYWTAAVSYTNGSGWLAISPTSGMNNGTVRLDATAANLGVGTYSAVLTIDAGSAGRRVVTITLTVTAPVPAGPQIAMVENAASFAPVPVVPGSLTTIMGSGLAGKNVSVTFNGLLATISYNSATQINLLVPSGLGAQSSAQVVVIVDGEISAPVTVQVAPFEPGIFAGAVLNQDSTVNGMSNPAAPGSVIYFYATGLSGAGTITARIGSMELTNLYYAGPAPGYPGVQQINLVLPPGVSGVTAALYACGTSAGVEVCSVGYPLTVK
jgi:uncharacterized protein (TIGR03437 family)